MRFSDFLSVSELACQALKRLNNSAWGKVKAPSRVAMTGEVNVVDSTAGRSKSSAPGGRGCGQGVDLCRDHKGQPADESERCWIGRSDDESTLPEFRTSYSYDFEANGLLSRKNACFSKSTFEWRDFSSARPRSTSACPTQNSK